MTKLSVESIDIVDIPEVQYHEESGIGTGLYITRGVLSNYLDSPSGCYLRHIERHERAQFVQTQAMRLGSFFDVLITEGEDRALHVYRKPECISCPEEWLTKSGNLSTSADTKAAIDACCKAGTVVEGVPKTLKAWQADMESQGFELFSPTDADLAYFMRERLLLNPLARRMLELSTGTQTTIRATLTNGLRVQCRLDLWIPDFGMIADLKTCAYTRADFVRQAYDKGYYLQDWLYTALAKAAGLDVREHMQFVVAMNRYPWDGYVIELPDDLRQWGGRRICRALDGIAAGHWGDLQTETFAPPLDTWIMQRIDADDADNFEPMTKV